MLKRPSGGSAAGSSIPPSFLPSAFLRSCVLAFGVSARRVALLRCRVVALSLGAFCENRPMDFLTVGREALAAQPFSVLIGAELVAVGDGRLEMRVPLRPELNQQHGFAHGGVV